MKITARIIHNGTESTFTSSDDQQSAAFFAAKAYEWVDGRRTGKFESHAANGLMAVAFADITSFAIEVTA